MNKKGFTLIELLAVIVILAIIALIATPIVLNIIKDSRESATLRSAENYMDGVANAIATTNMKEGGTFSPTICNITSDGNLLCDNKKITVDIDKEKPVSGSITFNRGKVEEVSLTYSNGKTIVNDEKGNLVYGEKGSIWEYTDENKNGQVDIGDMISIGKEKPQRFHIYENDGTNIKALAEYNLLVGNEVDSKYNVTQLSNSTGLQDPTAIGWNSIDAANANGKWYGTTPFSTSSNAYEGSIVEGYVNYYKTELIKLGAKETIQTRLITHDELTNENTFNCPEYGTCPDTYSWVYTTSYWSGSPIDDYNVWYVFSDGYFYGDYYSIGYSIGVRPVIIISLSEI